MLHHVGIEVAPADVEAAAGFFELIGFVRVEPPPTLSKFTWLEREGTQVHLMPTEKPTVPSPGHLAVVVAHFDATVERLRQRGFEVEPKREHWGEPRALAITPGGHRVELMAAPPAPSPQLPYIAVTGNIAVGKTTLVKTLAKRLGAKPLLEEVEDNPFFDRFYKAPGDWSFHSQVSFATNSLQRQAKAPGDQAVVQDRTVYEALDVFGRVLHREGHLSNREMAIFDWLRDVALAVPRQPTLLIHLHAPGDVIMQRIAYRGRAAERAIHISYIEALNTEYESFVQSWNLGPVLQIDTHRHDLRNPKILNDNLRMISLG